MSELALDTTALREDPRAVSAVDFEAEVRILAAVFADSSLLDEAAEKISPEDFGHLAHELTFAAMQACDASGRPVDPVTVADELTRAGSIKQVSGLDGLRYIAAAGAATSEEAAELVASATVDFAAYLDIVNDRATRRRLMAAARKITVEAGSGESDAEALVDSAEAAVFAVSATRSSSSALTMPQVVADVTERMAKARSSRLIGYSWGFKVLDDVTGGLQPGQMITIAGRPGTGKSTLATQVARYIAETNDVTVPVLSYEMQAGDIGMRLLSAASGVPLSEIMRGQIPDGMDDVIAVEAQKMAGLRMIIDDNPPSSMAGIRSYMRRLSRRAEVGALVIDYLQLLVDMQATGRNDNTEALIAALSRGTKLMATELKIPVIALSQLNRTLESRPNKRPILSDLRGSGSLEQDSNVVVMVHRPYLYDQTLPEHEAELIVAKNRNGAAPVTAYVDWDGACTRFRDSDRRGPTEEGPRGGGFGGAPAPQRDNGGGGGYSSGGGGFNGVDPFGF